MRDDVFHTGLHLGLGLLVVLGVLNLRFSGTLPFIIIFLFRYIRVLVNLHSYLFLYEASTLPKNPSIKPENVAVLIQTIGDKGDDFKDSVKRIANQRPYEIIICTTSANNNLETLEAARDDIQRQLKQETQGRPYHEVPIYCLAIEEQNRRKQFIHSLETSLALPQLPTIQDTPSTSPEPRGRENVLHNPNVTAVVMCDDHTFIRPGFLQYILAPLNNNGKVYIVNGSERVRRIRHSTWRKDFLNYVACVYAARHNFECAATYALDGGHFDVSGRFVVMRKELWEDKRTREAYVSERWGDSDKVLIPDDDAWIGRQCTQIGKEAAFQLDESHMLDIHLGNETWSKFNAQILRWARTSFRNGWTALYDDEIWKKKPWNAYAVHLTGLLSFPLLFDFLLGYNLYSATGLLGQHWVRWCLFCFWLFTKFLEPSGHWRMEKRDLIYAIPGLFFGWYYSIVKLRALFTVYDISWSGRASGEKEKSN
ncbi:hypothetical protein F5Y16DRAFT_72665 [Xylariaceae sp. FL0255]|nr:hypothetical protein F5Y16DRAFT_72665 [Xylariaceae sp. FL0255]